MADVGAPAPEVYRLSMEKLPLAVGRARRLALLELLVAATALVAVVELALRGSAAATDVALVVWGLAAVGVPYVLWRAKQRVRRRWNAFELSIGGETLRCAARGAGRVIMRLDDIASIAEGAGGLVVRSSARGVVVRIPRTVEGFVDVRARLAARRPIEGGQGALWWCAGLVGTGLLASATAFVWGRSASVAAGVLLCQVTAAVAGALDIRWHPRMPRSKTSAALLAIIVAAVLPVVGLALASLG
jgi:hypothetical protein